MALVRTCLSKILSHRTRNPFLSYLSPPPLTLSLPRIHSFTLSASLSTSHTTRFKPICLYHSQGKCTKMDDLIHLEKFNHDSSRELQVNISELNKIRSQNLDFFLILDLEGKVEILEFPVLMISAKTLQVEGIFHRVWHDTAIPFKEVIEEFEAWLMQQKLWIGGELNRAAFVTCGNWDLKTKVPQQCEVSRIKLPPYFMEWINLKDVYLNFYNRRATGMVTMMKELQIPLVGRHHLGIDDTKNIARVLQHMLVDGALIQITARRNPRSPRDVNFLFKNRI
ncbi:uncharacterized exonuclease domain-containing protein At3g15140 isoform X2 [Cicer arietinum]|uniref:Uncharacterized exonuclease domain-containing protein At3g15140 isoform X2 n=1 Tax=Cicer arietinum TaxID=3827 RepID=A0A3Q7YGL7_CICAR|nr:uncharacterized exonuclease domain-containing protein At3g15140 isoform X2 [Cicer arietinum]